MALTAVAINAAKPRQKQYKLVDTHGLYLLVTTTGSKWWRFNYRFDGKYRTLALGTYPIITLADARERRDEARRALAFGEDPMDRRKRLEREARAERAETFKLISDEWLERLEIKGRSAMTMKKMRWLIEMAIPDLGSRPIAQITAVEVLDVCRKVEVRGRHETAIRLRGTIGAILRYAIVTGRAQRDVTVELHGALITPRAMHRAAIIEPKAIGGLLRAIDSYEGQPTVEYALKLSPHLFVRPGELR
ncbi:MAG TPA: integrase arm-type DNA-binding domain-containing protein, partial [Novosphingobium sp.]